MIRQPDLFGAASEAPEIEKILLYALGDFQSRGKTLAERQLPLDRLLGAVRRAAEKFGVADLTDQQITENLQRLGAKIVAVPSFVAKHPFRVTVSDDLAGAAKEFYKQSLEND